MTKKIKLTCPCEEYEYTVSYTIDEDRKQIEPQYCVFCGAENEEPLENFEEEDDDWND